MKRKIRDPRIRELIKQFMGKGELEKELNRQCDGCSTDPIKLKLTDGAMLILKQDEVAEALPDGIFPFPVFDPPKEGWFLVWTEEQGWAFSRWEGGQWDVEDRGDYSLTVLYWREQPADPEEMEKSK